MTPMAFTSRPRMVESRILGLIYAGILLLGTLYVVAFLGSLAR